MGYYAGGNGTCILKESATEKQVLEAIKDCELIGDPDFEYEFETIDNRNAIWINQNDWHWHDEEVTELFDALAPFIESGELLYSGDEDCHWKYKFSNGEWKEYDGTIIYDYVNELTVEQCLGALKAKGYKVRLTANRKES